MFLFLDIETTGLDPASDYMLELGMVLTTDKFVVIDQFSRVICPEVWSVWSRQGLVSLKNYLPAVVFDMHKKSGLLSEVSFGIHPRQAEEEAIDWLELALAKDQPVAGSSVHFDRSFIKAQMPTLDSKFHYRNIDVSTLKELAKRWAPEVHDSRPLAQAKHRALPDIHDTIQELVHYQKRFIQC